MASFNSFADRLPDPNFGVGEDGSSSNSAITGPGFSSVQFSSERPISISRTNSGRVISRAIVGQRWRIQISYNPMTRDEFEPVYNFLQARGRLIPFFVSLPQHKDSRNSSLSGTIRTDGAVVAGATNVRLDGFSDNVAANGLRPGDMITFTDTSNSNHKKAYQINKVLTNSNFLAGNQPNSGERIVYVTPPIEKAIANNMVVNYENVLIRVMMTTDVIEYSLGTNNLYEFSLNLEECQP